MLAPDGQRKTRVVRDAIDVVPIATQRERVRAVAEREAQRASAAKPASAPRAITTYAPGAITSGAGSACIVAAPSSMAAAAELERVAAPGL